MQNAIMSEPDLGKIKALLQSGVDPNAPIGCGTFAALDGAILKQNPALVDLLIAQGAKPTENQIVRAAFSSNHDAAVKMVMSLHAAGAPIDARSYYSKENDRYTTVLHNAVWRENTILIAYLLKQNGVPLNDVNVDGFTPLMIAVEHGNASIVDMLLAAGTDPLKKNKEGLDAAAVVDRMIAKQNQLKSKIRPKA